MGSLQDMVDRTRKIGEVAKTLAGSGFMRKTVLVHPQLSSTPEEAAKLASDWKAKEERQLQDNLAKLLR